MLSRLSRQIFCRKQNLVPYIQQGLRNYSDLEPGAPSDFELVREEEEKVIQVPIREWVATELSDDAPRKTPFESPERDHVNFPRPVIRDAPAPTRLIVFPENWFQFMYSKMGVSGPYVLGIGVWLLFVQKEWVITHGPEWEHFQAYIMWCYIFTRSQLGNIIREAMAYRGQVTLDNMRTFVKEAKENRHDAIKFEKECQSSLGVLKTFYDVKKQNVGLQMEASYRDNVMDIYNQVKRRLDYQVAVSQIDSRIKQQFMVNWVIDQVQKSIGNTSEKDTLNQCISDLNVLAAKV